jgi:hypothetical protein
MAVYIIIFDVPQQRNRGRARSKQRGGTSSCFFVSNDGMVKVVLTQEDVYNMRLMGRS